MALLLKWPPRDPTVPWPGDVPLCIWMGYWQGCTKPHAARDRLHNARIPNAGHSQYPGKQPACSIRSVSLLEDPHNPPILIRRCAKLLRKFSTASSCNIYLSSMVRRPGNAVIEMRAASGMQEILSKSRIIRCARSLYPGEPASKKTPSIRHFTGFQDICPALIPQQYPLRMVTVTS